MLLKYVCIHTLIAHIYFRLYHCIISRVLHNKSVYVNICIIYIYICMYVYYIYIAYIISLIVYNTQYSIIYMYTHKYNIFFVHFFVYYT